MSDPERPTRSVPPRSRGGRAPPLPRRACDDLDKADDAAPDPQEDLRRKLLALARALARQMADTDHKAMVARRAARSASREKAGPPKAGAPKG